MPETVLNGTDWLLLSGNNLGSLNKVPNYLNNITMLNLSSSDISDIDETVIETIIQHVKSLDIRVNNLKEISETFAKSNKTNKFWISDNPYECNCDMLWMKDWLMDKENVVDKNDVKCVRSKEKGKMTFYNN